MQLQYNKLKKRYPDCILLFRLGDFYECFYEDAKVLSYVLGIALTGRGKGVDRMPMAGIPHHALTQYLPKLVSAGLKIAIAEQLEKPKPGKLVDRNITKIITAGTITDEKNLDSTKNNYLVCLYSYKLKRDEIFGFASIDLTTADFFIYETSITINKFPKEIIDEINRLKPNEILVCEKIKKQISSLYTNILLTTFDEDYASLDKSRKTLLTQFGTTNLIGFGVDNYTAGIIAAAQIIEYLKETQKTNLAHITKISKLNFHEFMQLDIATIRNLEILEPISSSRQEATIYGVLNKCRTSMGQRMLRTWLLEPLINKNRIKQRLDGVSVFINDKQMLTSIRNLLSNVYDIERILGRIGLSSANARDLKSLQLSLENILKIGQLDFSKSEILKKILAIISKSPEVNYIIDLIKNGILDDPSPNLMEGNIIKDAFDEELDALKIISKGGKNEIIKIQQKEIKTTGISSLKINYNNIFGYYIEVSKSNLDKVPNYYIRKQTLVNAERFITNELKDLEEKVLGAEEKIIQLEYDLFCKIRSDIAQYIPSLQELSKAVGCLDILANFGYIALENNYVRPIFNENFELKNTRHPVIEKLSNEPFIPNDLSLNSKKNFMILTGPNMSGKSTYIRQIACISLMAQIGSYVPASQAQLPILDRIFTRVGASDNLVEGQSTFMVEMNETANILNNATEKSLIILDEVGRGTSTYDGVAIAWAITEYIHDKIKSYTLFATHYHELIELEKKLARIVNYNVEVKEENEKVIFLRKIVKGGTDKSYGIEVAKLAGIPKEIIRNANKILESLENNSSDIKVHKPQVQFAFIPFGENNKSGMPLTKKSKDPKSNNFEIKKLKKIEREIKRLDLERTSPFDALLKLKKFKELLSRKS